MFSASDLGASPGGLSYLLVIFEGSVFSSRVGVSFACLCPSDLSMDWQQVCLEDWFFCRDYGGMGSLLSRRRLE